MIAGLIERMLPGPYKIGAVRLQSRATVTNKAAYVAYRGTGWGRGGVHAGADDRHHGQRSSVVEPLDFRLQQRRHPRRGAAADGDRAPASPVSRRGESLGAHRRAVDLPAFRQRQAASAAHRALPRHRLRQLHRGRPRGRTRAAARRDGQRDMRMRLARRRHRARLHRARCRTGRATRRRSRRSRPTSSVCRSSRCGSSSATATPAVRDDRRQPGGDDGRRCHAPRVPGAAGAVLDVASRRCSRPAPATS